MVAVLFECWFRLDVLVWLMEAKLVGFVEEVDG